MNGKVNENSDLAIGNMTRDEVNRRIECEHEERAVLLF